MTLFLCAISFFAGAFFWSLIVVAFVVSKFEGIKKDEGVSGDE